MNTDNYKTNLGEVISEAYRNVSSASKKLAVGSAQYLRDYSKVTFLFSTLPFAIPTYRRQYREKNLNKIELGNGDVPMLEISFEWNRKKYNPLVSRPALYTAALLGGFAFVSAANDAPELLFVPAVTNLASYLYESFRSAKQKIIEKKVSKMVDSIDQLAE